MKVIEVFLVVFLGTLVSAKHVFHKERLINPISVYELNNPNEGVNLKLDFQTSMLYFADKLGVSDYFNIGEGSADSIDLIDQIHYDSDSSKPKLVMTVSGLSKFDHVDPVFKTFGNGKQIVSEELVSDIATEKNSTVIELTRELRLVSNQNHELVGHFKFFNDKLMGIWQNFKSFGVKDHSIKFETTHVNFINEKGFINELSQLIHLSDIENLSGEDVLFFESHSLNLINKKLGKESTTFQFCENTLIHFLVTLSQTFDITLITTPKPKHIEFTKRNSELQQVFAKKSAGSFFATEEGCKSATSDCSGHGACAQTGDDSWQCLCKPTVSKKKTTSWTGYDCSVKDVSTQFNLLFWSSLALAITMVSGVKLLASIGGEALPGVLDAATSSKKTL